MSNFERNELITFQFMCMYMCVSECVRTCVCQSVCMCVSVCACVFVKINSMYMQFETSEMYDTIPSHIHTSTHP